MLDLRKSTTGFVSLIGHRGALASAPENTLPGFEEGLAQGANLLELDIHQSRDRELVVIHDFTVDRTTDGTGYVKDLTLHELKRLDAGSRFSPAFKGARIPLFREVLEWAKGRVCLAIEIKSDWITYEGIEAALVDHLRRYEMVDQVMVVSFDHCALKRVKDHEPNVSTGAIYNARFVDPLMVARSARVNVLRPRWPFASTAEIRAAHAEGLAYSPWGPNDPAIWRQLVEMGVDTLSADRPADLRAILGPKK
jgi:glycerophosphoryl diester phosphodiesterase